MTNISMEWTDDGAVVLSNIPITCPRCESLVEANVEHRCGDKVGPETANAKPLAQQAPRRRPKNK